ncbi:hypothetical protein AALP_AA8G020700 [Arabis alpina]|uniref:F-box domain-containing protein n=1 Tax=Arabis alpina TaxID=50452 RepID=A0A087G4F3_ARAAL|nr:hypothetical protein AALP_AA8G020700 [Arabis alpina]
MEEMNKSSESPSPPPPTSFSSLPYDLVLNCLARISLIHRPTLSLVSKSFRSLLASGELYAARSRIGKTEDCLYVFLNPNKRNPNPRWFALAPIPQRQKLLPIPLCIYQHPQSSSTVVSIGSKIYIIGGFFKGIRCTRVLVLDCQSHQWSRLPQMRVRRAKAAADVIDGKIYVIGGCKSNKSEDWGEVYDIKTQTWEPLSPETLDLTPQKSVVPERLVMGGKVYTKDGLKLNFKKGICLVEIDKNVLCQIFVTNGKLFWRDANEELRGWCKVWGLEELSSNYLVWVVNSCGGGRVIVWWKKQLEIWCAEISFERRGFEELLGFVEWSKNVLTFDGCDSGFDFFLHSAIVTH